MPETFMFQLSEALGGLRRARLMAAVTVTTVAVALSVLGGFLVLLRVTDHYLGRLRSSLKLVVYARPSADAATITGLRRTLDTDGAVAALTFIAKEDALKQVFEELGEKAWVLRSLDQNPLVDAFEVELAEGAEVPEFVRRCQGTPGVDRVSQGQEWVDRLLRMVSVVRVVGLGIVLALGLATLAIVASTIWLTVYARRDEISVQKLVGATNWFIRFPFLMEGLLTGLAGALLASVVVIVGYRFVLVRADVLVGGLAPPITWPELRHVTLQLHLMGAILGLLGSLLSLRRIAV